MQKIDQGQHPTLSFPVNSLVRLSRVGVYRHGGKAKYYLPITEAIHNDDKEFLDIFAIILGARKR